MDPFQVEHSQILSQERHDISMFCVALMPALYAPHAGRPVCSAIRLSGEKNASASPERRAADGVHCTLAAHPVAASLLGLTLAWALGPP